MVLGWLVDVAWDVVCVFASFLDGVKDCFVLVELNCFECFVKDLFFRLSTALFFEDPPKICPHAMPLDHQKLDRMHDCTISLFHCFTAK